MTIVHSLALLPLRFLLVILAGLFFSASAAATHFPHNRNVSAGLRTPTCCLTVLALTVLAGCRPNALTKQQLEGQHLYDVRCAHCHRDNDLGLKKVPPGLQNLFARPKLPSGAPATDAEIVSVIQNGRGMMPGFFGRFTQDQMNALLAYLHAGIREPHS